MVVLVISLLLTLGLVLFIVPQFAELYGESAEKLPFFTQILLNFSLFLRQFGLWLMLGFLVIFIAFKIIKKHSKKQKKTKLWRENLPIFGELFRLSRLCNFSFSLSLMLKAGIPLPLALQSFLPYATTQDPRLKRDIDKALKGLHQGYAFSTSLSPHFFPPAAKQMLQIGEQTGQLGEMLGRIGKDTQQKIDHQIEMLSQLIEPLLMVVIGSIIGVIMLAMYLPIFNMGSLIQ